MKIAVLSKSDIRGGGASVVASRLVEAYRALGHEADHFHSLAGPGRNLHGRHPVTVQRLKGVEGRLGYRDHWPVEKWLSGLGRIARGHDAIHLHDMSTVMSHTSLGWLANRVPTIWTLHDCSPFTAGCLYPGECDRFTGTCGPCPQLGNWPLNTRFDHTASLHRRRRRIVDTDMHFSAPSRWMIGEYLRAGWPEDRIAFVPNGVDTAVYKPRNRTILRKKYGLDGHKGPLLLFSSGWLHDSRKGPGEVAKLAHSLRDLNPKLIMTGRFSDEAAELFKTANVAHFGFVDTEAEKAELYGMCDATLTFSQQENAPLIAIESLAVGTPVFGYAAGGLAEIVENGKTGWMAPIGQIAEVIAKTREMLSGNTKSLRNACAKAAVENHDYARVAQHYINLFSELQETNRASFTTAKTGVSHAN